MPTMFYCGNDADAKSAAAQIIEQFGWETADMGTAKAARAIESLCQLWCIPGFRQNAWTDHAFTWFDADENFLGRLRRWKMAKAVS